MANVNAGAWIRFENGAIILVGADTLLNLVPGSVRVRTMQRERVQNIDRGVLTAVTIGDERQQEIEFELYRTSTLETVIATMTPAATNGVETFFSFTIKVPDYLGAAAGKQWVWNRCYMPDGPEYQAGGSGQEADRVRIRLIHAGGIVVATTY